MLSSFPRVGDRAGNLRTEHSHIQLEEVPLAEEFRSIGEVVFYGFNVSTKSPCKW